MGKKAHGIIVDAKQAGLSETDDLLGFPNNHY